MQLFLLFLLKLREICGIIVWDIVLIRGGKICLKSKVRPLTTLERARIQTFPASFEFSGSKTDLEQMIGNAVPVDLAKYVAIHLKRYIEDPICVPLQLQFTIA